MKRLLLTASLGLMAALSQANPPYVSVDGHMINFPDVQPRFMYDRVMVPIRGVFERMNAHVIWDAREQKITCIGDHATVELMIGDNRAIVDGHRIQFDAPATMSHGRALVPLHFLALALGARVQWNDPSQTAEIYTPGYDPLNR